MNACKTAGGLAAASFIFLSGQAAWADVTAQQVWNDWQTYMESFGYDIEAQEMATSDSVTVEELTMSVPIPEEDAVVDIIMSGLKFADQGDGTVAVSMPDTMPMTIRVTGEGAEDVTVTLNYITRDMAMTVSGDPQNMAYDYSASSLVMELAGLVVDGETMDIGTGRFEIADMEGTATTTVGNVRTYEQQVSTGPISYALDIKDPEGSGGRMVLNGGSDSLAGEGTTTVPKDLDMTDMAAALKAGFAVEGGYRVGPGSMTFDFQDGSDAAQGKTSSGGSEFIVTMSQDRMRYGFTTRDIAMEFAGSEIPFPVALAAAKIGFELLTPLSETETPQDAALKVDLTEFTMSDMIWSIFDPQGKLPRDPATIALDLTGKLRLLIDVLDPEQMEAVESGQKMPGELHAATLNNLTVSAAGAELTGQGEVEFDNSDMASYGGMPKPVGAVNLTLVGGNGLLDKLIAMGLVSEDDAMGMRMMLGMFAVPGDGEDTLRSEITFTEDGQIQANGQRLK